VLVTGGAGAIGSNLTRRLLELDARVCAIDDFSSAPAWNLAEHPRLRLVRGSILDPAALAGAFEGGPSLVFHLAAFFANQNSVDHPEDDLMVNGLGTLRVLQRAQEAGVERVVYASSSSSFYGPETPLPYREEDVSLRRTTPYQITKLLGELYCTYFQTQCGVPTVKLRFFNSYGPGEMPGRYRNVIPNFVYMALNGRPLPVMGSGEETRDFTYVEDLIDGVLRAGSVEEAAGLEINLGSGRETRIVDLANAVNEATGNRAGVAPSPRRGWDTTVRRVASIERARRVLGYEPRTSLTEGLPRAVCWVREHRQRIAGSLDRRDEAWLAR
jgi:UDP-glucose 4-epimerase